LTWGIDQFQTDIKVTSCAIPWSHLRFKNNPNDFQFAIISDLTGGYRQGIFEKAVKEMNLLQPEFVMSVGDLIQGYTIDEVELDRQWNVFSNIIKKLEMPFFYVPGNHDVTNAVMADKWHQRFGPTYYHFVYRDVLFLCLDTQDMQGNNIGKDQTNYFCSGVGTISECSLDVGVSS